MFIHHDNMSHYQNIRNMTCPGLIRRIFMPGNEYHNLLRTTADTGATQQIEHPV